MAAAVWTEAWVGCESARNTVEIESACVVNEDDGMMAKRLLVGWLETRRAHRDRLSKSYGGGDGVTRLFWTRQRYCLHPEIRGDITCRDAKPLLTEVGLDAGGVRPF